MAADKIHTSLMLQACRAGRTGIKLPPLLPLRAFPASAPSPPAAILQAPAAKLPPQQPPQPAPPQQQPQPQQPARSKVALSQKPKDVVGLAPAEIPVPPREELSPPQSLPETITPSARSADLRVVGWTEVCPSPAGPISHAQYPARILQSTPDSLYIGIALHGCHGAFRVSLMHCR